MKVYWLLVAAVPFYPAFELFELQERLACAYGTPCFDYGLPFQVEGATAGVLTGVYYGQCVSGILAENICGSA
jgi:hypothetical protein